MYYERAVEIMKDAQRHMTPQGNPIMWDLVSGMVELVRSIESDNQDLKARLDRIETLLQSRR